MARLARHFGDAEKHLGCWKCWEMVPETSHGPFTIRRYVYIIYILVGGLEHEFHFPQQLG